MGQNSPPPKTPPFPSILLYRGPRKPPLLDPLPEPPKSASRRGAPAGGKFCRFSGGRENPGFWPFSGTPRKTPFLALFGGSWEGVLGGGLGGLQKGGPGGGPGGGYPGGIQGGHRGRSGHSGWSSTPVIIITASIASAVTA